MAAPQTQTMSAEVAKSASARVPRDEPGCCQQGGCCSAAPPPEQMDFDGRTRRLNLLYDPVGCTAHSRGLARQSLDTVPDALQEKGVLSSDWQEIMGERLFRDVQTLRRAPCSPMMMCLWPPVLLCTVVTLGGICCLICPEEKKEQMKWDRALREWEDTANERFFKPKGMLLHAQSRCVVTRGSKGEKNRHIYRWFAIALDEEEAERLKLEPRKSGDVENGCGCECCPNEQEMLIHP